MHNVSSGEKDETNEVTLQRNTEKQDPIVKQQSSSQAVKSYSRETFLACFRYT